MKTNKVKTNQLISFYKSTNASSERYYKEYTYTLEFFINKCKSDAYKLSTEKIRSITDKKERDELKTSDLPCIASVGVLSRRKKNKKYFEYVDMEKSDASTGYVFGDIDQLDGYSMQDIKDVLMDDDNIFFIKESISGNGFHFIFQIDGGVEYYKPALEFKYEELSKKLGNKIDHNSFDERVKDWTRVMVLNYDPNLYYDTNKIILEAKGNIEEDDNVEKISAEKQIFIDKTKIRPIEDISIDVVKRFDNHIQRQKWISSKRNSAIGSMKWFMRENIDISLEDISVLFHNFVNGAYTQDYTPMKIDNDISKMYSDVQEEKKQNIEVKTFIAEKKQESAWRIGDTIYFDKYINDRREETFQIIKNKLDDNKILLIDAPTGGGKTHSMYQFIEDFNLKADFILPTRLLTEQQKEHANFVIGSSKNIFIKDAVVCSTWENLPKLQPRQSDLLIIDEAHLMINSFNFKIDAIKSIIEYSKNYKNVILLTGTPEPFDSFFDNSKLAFRKNSNINITYDIIPFRKRDISFVATQVAQLNKDNCLNIYYKNNLDEIEQIKEVLQKQTELRVGILSSEEKDGEIYYNIKENSILGEDLDWLLTTCVIREGINIKDDIDNVNIVFGNGVDITEIKQFAARFRNAKNIHITVLHKDLNYCQYIDRNEVNKILSNWKDEYNKFKNETNNFIYGEFKKFFKTVPSLIYEEDGLIKVNTIQILSYFWMYNKFNQVNNLNSLKYFMDNYFEEDKKMTFNPIDLNIRKVKNIKEEYNQNMKAKKMTYTAELLEGGEIKEDFNYQTKINENYFKLIKYFTKEDIKTLPVDIMSKNLVDKFIKNLKFIINYKTYKLGYDIEKNIDNMMNIKYINFTDHVLSLNKSLTAEDIYKELSNNNLIQIQFTISNPIGLNVKASTIDLDGKKTKIYSYSLLTLEDLKLPKKLRDYDKLKDVINGGMSKREVIAAWEKSMKVNEFLGM